MQRMKIILVSLLGILSSQICDVSFCFAGPKCQDGKVLVKGKPGDPRCIAVEPQITELSADRISVLVGEPITISWRTVGLLKCSLSTSKEVESIPVLPTEGTFTLRSDLPVRRDIELDCSSPLIDHQRRSLQVEFYLPPQISILARAGEPIVLTTGESPSYSIKVLWSARNVEHCALDGEGVAIDGERDVTIFSTEVHTLTLRCSGGLSVRTVERTLDVNPPSFPPTSSPPSPATSPPTTPPTPSSTPSPDDVLKVPQVTDDNDDPPASPSANAPIWRRWGRFMLIQDIGGGTYFGWQGKADVAGTSAVKSAFHHSFSARAEHTIWFGKNDLGVQLGLYGRWSFYQPRLADSLGKSFDAKTCPACPIPAALNHSVHLDGLILFRLRRLGFGVIGGGEWWVGGPSITGPRKSFGMALGFHTARPTPELEIQGLLTYRPFADGSPYDVGFDLLIHIKSLLTLHTYLSAIVRNPPGSAPAAPLDSILISGGLGLGVNFPWPWPWSRRSGRGSGK